jgi:hypothetical protein
MVFVLVSHFPLSLTFVGKAGTYLSGTPNGTQLEVKGLSRKLKLKATNTLAYSFIEL